MYCTSRLLQQLKHCKSPLLCTYCTIIENLKQKGHHAARNCLLTTKQKDIYIVEVQQLITMDDGKMAWRVIWCPLSNFHGDVDMGKRLYLVTLLKGFIKVLTPGGGGAFNFFSGRSVRPGFPKCGACKLTFASEKGGLVSGKFPNLGACELKISKFRGL